MKNKTIITKKICTAKEMLNLGADLAKIILNGTIIYLIGELGAGKTTLVRGFLHALNYTGKVKSPSYTLIESYEMDSKIIHHFDFYRLNNPNELKFIGIEEYFASAAICLIEWPEKGLPQLPPADLTCDIIFKETGRIVNISPCTMQGDDCLKKLI